MNTLRTVIRLEIDDFGETPELRDRLRAYHDTIVEMLTRDDISFFLHGVTTWAVH